MQIQGPFARLGTPHNRHLCFESVFARDAPTESPERFCRRYARSPTRGGPAAAAAPRPPDGPQRCSACQGGHRQRAPQEPRRPPIRSSDHFDGPRARRPRRCRETFRTIPTAFPGREFFPATTRLAGRAASRFATCDWASANPRRLILGNAAIGAAGHRYVRFA